MLHERRQGGRQPCGTQRMHVAAAHPSQLAEQQQRVRQGGRRGSLGEGGGYSARQEAAPLDKRIAKGW